MKADQMYNTFVEGQQPFTFKRNKPKSKRKSIQINNLSGSQLNPWNDQPSKSYAYLEGQHIFSSPKIFSNFSPVYNQSSQKYQQKNINNKLNNSTKKWKAIEVHKDQYFLNKQKKIRETKEQQINLMNKTISVHNFSGEKVFNQIMKSNIMQRKRSSTIEQKKDNRKTIISNPMYLKFCNKFASERQKLLTRRKHKLSNFDPKMIDYESEEVTKIKQKMMTFYVQNGDMNRVKNIHEVRKRLQSNSRKTMSQIQACEEAGLNIFENERLNRKCRTIQLQKQEARGNVQQIKQRENECEKQKSSDKIATDLGNKQLFKLGPRKNLYIGYRKFFHPLYHVIGKERNLLMQDQPSQIQKNVYNN